MSRIRSLLLWLVVLVMPLQGLAAGSMLFCGMGEHHASVPQALATGPAQGVAARHAVAHDGLDQHAVHDGAGPDARADAGKLDDLSHQCGLCASCCFQVAIAGPLPVLPLAAAPRAGPAEPLVLIRTLPPRVPEKPPRA